MSTGFRLLSSFRSLPVSNRPIGVLLVLIVNRRTQERNHKNRSCPTGRPTRLIGTSERIEDSVGRGVGCVVVKCRHFLLHRLFFYEVFFTRNI